MLAIKTENLSKSYTIKDLRSSSLYTTQKWALKDVSIDVAQGDALAILGKNGSGKSTLLKILASIIHPSNGRFFINGKLSALLEIGAGFDPELTGRENIFLNATLQGMSRNEVRRHLDSIIDFSEIDEYIDTPVKHYSSGMYMRLGFAVMVHTPSEIMVIDEALAVGDMSFQQKCLRKMIELRHEHGRTVLLVSHNIENIRTLCSTAALLHDGEIAAYGNVLDVAAQYFEESLSAEDTPFDKRKDRFGNGKATATSITFLDKHGMPAEVLYSGEPLSVKFEIAHQSDVVESEIVVACAFGASFGQYLVGWISSESNRHPRDGSITLNIDSLDLRPGTYFFTYRLGIGTISPENIVDGVENGFVFTVLSRNERSIAFPSCIGRGDFS